MSDTVQWLGQDFNVHPHSANWSNVAGVYIFCGVNSQNQWTPFYIGQASSFQDRLPSHEIWNKAQSLGATHVHARVVSPGFQRDSLEAELIQKYQPPLNTQSK